MLPSPDIPFEMTLLPSEGNVSHWKSRGISTIQRDNTDSVNKVIFGACAKSRSMARNFWGIGKQQADPRVNRYTHTLGKDAWERANGKEVTDMSANTVGHKSFTVIALESRLNPSAMWRVLV